jgi:RNA polymerase sigma factor (sigma-70 family)
LSEVPPPSAAPPAPADERLVAGILSGEEGALSQVRRWVRGAIGPYRFRLAAEIEDIEQEILIDLLRALAAGRFEGRSLLATYVRRMVHHKCLNRLRSRRGRQWVDCSEVELVDPEPTPFERERRRGEFELGLRVLAGMPEPCRELWRMIHRGLSYEAIASASASPPERFAFAYCVAAKRPWPCAIYWPRAVTPRARTRHRKGWAPWTAAKSKSVSPGMSTAA